MSKITISFESDDYYSEEEEEVVEEPVPVKVVPRLPEITPETKFRPVRKQDAALPTPEESSYSYTYEEEQKNEIPMQSGASQTVVSLCVREKSWRKTEFRLFENEVITMNATKRKNTVVIFSGDGKLSDPLAVMKILNQKRTFTMFSPEGTIIMQCKVSKVREPILYERFFTVQMLCDGVVVNLTSKMPVLGAGGRYIINFGGKLTRPSIKNAILIDADQQKLIIVRKIADNSLEIERNVKMSALLAFAFSIVSFVCPY